MLPALRCFCFPQTRAVAHVWYGVFFPPRSAIHPITIRALTSDVSGAAPAPGKCKAKSNKWLMAPFVGQRARRQIFNLQHCIWLPHCSLNFFYAPTRLQMQCLWQGAFGEQTWVALPNRLVRRSWLVGCITEHRKATHYFFYINSHNCSKIHQPFCSQAFAQAAFSLDILAVGDCTHKFCVLNDVERGGGGWLSWAALRYQFYSQFRSGMHLAEVAAFRETMCIF